MVTCSGISKGGRTAEHSRTASGQGVSRIPTLLLPLLTMIAVMGYSSDGFPHVGAIPDKPGQFICAGFSGHGMPQVFLSAKAIATMVVQGKDVEEVDMPRLYRASKERVNSQQEHATLSAWKKVFEQPKSKL